MTRDEALTGIVSTDAEFRLRSARFFALNAHGGDRRRLRAALKKETVPWIKRALERALQRAGSTAVDEPAASLVYADPPPQLIAELRAKAIDEVAGTIIHELSTLVASLKLAAPRDVERYQGSRTETLVNSLASLVTGIRNLKAAASRATFVQCDLAKECRDACALYPDRADWFRFAGKAPFLVEIDPDLLKLALTNIIRNAVEAVSALPADVDQVITLNWGRAGHEHWLAVLDTGMGFELEPSALIDFGQSTKNKEEHIGFGLATAKQAMQAMEGDVYPGNATDGGARVELRWFDNDENSIR